MIKNWIVRLRVITQKNALLFASFKRHKVKDASISSVYNIIFKQKNKSEVVELKQVGKVYDNGFRAINNFNLVIQPGEFISFLGPSGCGKTTILRMIAGLEYISEGTLKQGDVILNSALPQERSLSMVFQNYALYPYMNVFQNIAFGLKLATFNNPISKHLLDQYKILKNPFLAHTNYVKVQIRKLKKPFFEEILNTKKDLLLAKTSVDKSWQNFLKIKRKLKLLHLQSKEKVQLSKMEINNLRKELKELNQKNKDHKHNNKLHKKNKKKEQKKLSKENKLHQLIKNLKKDNKEIALNFKKKLKLEFLRIDKESQNYNTDIKKKIKNNNLEIQIFKKSLWSQKNINQKEELKTKIQKLKIKNQEMESQLISQHFYISELKINKKQDYKEKCKNLKNKIFKLKEEYKHFEPSQDKYQEYLESLAVWKYSINERVLFFSKMTGIDKYLKRKPAALSGGQRQRIALVRAISKNVKMFLFDEPLSNLDAKLRGSMRTEIKALHKNLGTTSIFVTHDQVEATTMSDRIVLINRGYIQQIGTPHELFFEPANVFTSDFIGSPRINLISAKLVSTNSIQFGSRKIHFVSKKKIVWDKVQEVIIGVRPQDIILDRTILEGAKKSNVFTGEIQQVENIGHERKYILQIPELENSFVVTSSNQYLINEVGKKIRFYINPSRIHIFDAETGISLSSVINKETRKAHAIWTQSTQERIKNMILLDDEKNKEKFSKKIVKDFLGYLLPTYGRQRRLFKMERKIKKYKDVSIVDVIKQTGN